MNNTCSKRHSIKLTLKLIATCAILAGTSSTFSQETIKIANIVELSGGGVSAGTKFKNGVKLAVKEINASGGILGKKIQTKPIIGETTLTGQKVIELAGAATAPAPAAKK